MERHSTWRSISSASQPSIKTTPIPWANGIDSEKASGAAW
jgi:hypothetical protein